LIPNTINRYQEAPFIVIKNTANFAQSSPALLHHWTHAPRCGDVAPR
jgi:hypothetical protein